jgi:hypothetical protein
MITALQPPPSPAPARREEACSPNYPGPSRAARVLQQHAVARKLHPRTLLVMRHPGNPLPMAPGRGPSRCTQPPCGRDRSRRRQSRRPRASGPAVAVLASACRARQYPAHAAAVPAESLRFAWKRIDGSAQRISRFERRRQSAPPPGSTLPLSRASLVGNRPAQGVSATGVSTMRVPFTSGLH